MVYDESIARHKCNSNQNTHNGNKCLRSENVQHQPPLSTANMPSIPSIVWRLCPWVTKVSSSLLFTSEAAQLTNDHTHSHLFSFANSSSRNATSACEVFLGDASWPSLETWSLFKETLNGSLMQTVPPAASCYPSW